MRIFISSVLLSLTLLFVACSSGQSATATDTQSVNALPKMVVYKSPTCGCCGKWVEHMRDNGFLVDVVEENDLTRRKRSLGVPAALGSCHTAVVDGYVIEGHVPAQDVHKLLAERPQGKGLAVPGMPAGSPGMEMGDRRDDYTVWMFNGEKPPQAFAQHGGG